MTSSEKMREIWTKALEEYCQDYNIPIEYLAETLKDPKVIPMIRGKAFEFSVILKLKDVLPSSTWLVEKPFINPQLGFHDQDVLLTHIKSGKKISIECKLAAKGGFKKIKTNYQIRVKCMRSRTLGAEQVEKLAPQRGLTVQQLTVHNDQYLPSDFDAVITSIGNSFYETDDSGVFVWKPTDDGKSFLESIYDKKSDMSSKDFAFLSMYVAKSSDLAINDNGVICTRKKCTEKESCGFIPNYPVIKFSNDSKEPLSAWISLENSERIFLSIIGE